MSEEEDLSLFHQVKLAMGSALGAFVGDSIVYPFDTMNTWVKLDSSISKVKVVQNKISALGYRSLYGGINAQFGCIFLPETIYFFIYQYSNKRCRELVDLLEKPRLIPFIPTITATFAEFVSLYALLPFDAMRVRLQSGAEQFKATSLYSAFAKTIRSEGILRLFTGSPLYMSYAIVTNTLLFQSYEYIRIGLKSEKQGDFNLQNTIVATALATSITTIFTNPIDLLITRYQCYDHSVEGKESMRLVNLVKREYNSLGLVGMQRGLLLRMSYFSIQAAFTLSIFEYIRQKYGYDFSD